MARHRAPRCCRRLSGSGLAARQNTNQRLPMAAAAAQQCLHRPHSGLHTCCGGSSSLRHDAAGCRPCVTAVCRQPVRSVGWPAVLRQMFAPSLACERGSCGCGWLQRSLPGGSRDHAPAVAALAPQHRMQNARRSRRTPLTLLKLCGCLKALLAHAAQSLLPGPMLGPLLRSRRIALASPRPDQTARHGPPQRPELLRRGPAASGCAQIVQVLPRNSSMLWAASGSITRAAPLSLPDDAAGPPGARPAAAWPAT